MVRAVALSVFLFVLSFQSRPVLAAPPVVDAVTAASAGYVIRGKNFGRQKSAVKVFEGNKQVDAGRVASVRDTLIAVRGQPVPGVSIKVLVSGQASNSKVYRRSSSARRPAAVARPSVSRSVDTRSRQLAGVTRQTSGLKGKTQGTGSNVTSGVPQSDQAAVLSAGSVGRSVGSGSSGNRPSQRQLMAGLRGSKRGQQGKTTEEVTADGTIITTYDNGDEIYLSPNGDMTFLAGDGSTVTFLFADGTAIIEKEGYIAYYDADGTVEIHWDYGVIEIREGGKEILPSERGSSGSTNILTKAQLKELLARFSRLINKLVQDSKGGTINQSRTASGQIAMRSTPSEQAEAQRITRIGNDVIRRINVILSKHR